MSAPRKCTCRPGAMLYCDGCRVNIARKLTSRNGVSWWRRWVVAVTSFHRVAYAVIAVTCAVVFAVLVFADRRRSR